MNDAVTSALSSLPTAPGPTAAAHSGSTSGAGSGTILLPHPSPSLSAQPAGQLVRAVVLGRTADGKVIIDTIYGKFSLPLPGEPAAGSVLQLQIVKAGTPVELLLIGQDSRPSGAPPQPILRLAQPPPALLTLTAGEVIRAVATGTTADGRTLVDTRFGQLSLALNPPPAAGSSLQLQIAKSGTPLELRLLSVNGPGGPATPARAPATLTPGATVDARFVPTGAANTAAAHNFHARIVAIHTTPPVTASDGAVVSGRIVASQAGGPTVIETAGGRIILPTVGSAVGGAVAERAITLQILAEPGTVLPTDPAAAQRRDLLTLSHNWTALDDTLTALRADNPALAAQFAATALPTTGSTLTAGIALFVALLTRGALADWLNPDVARLLQGSNRHALLSRLGDDFAHMARLAGEPTNSDWRVAMIPLVHEGALHQVRLYLRRRQRDEDTDTLGLSTRFVIEAALSHLGNIQLDGLVRPKRFDLMVRTQAPLPRVMRTDIAALFDQALAEFAIAGRIAFQVQSRFAVGPSDDRHDHAVGVYA